MSRGFAYRWICEAVDGVGGGGEGACARRFEDGEAFLVAQNRHLRALSQLQDGVSNRCVTSLPSEIPTAREILLFQA